MRGPAGYFKQTEAQWTVLAGALRDLGQIPVVKPAAAYFTNAYLPE
jgi:hypothetical protein